MQESSLKQRYVIKLFANIISAVIGAIMIAIVPRALGPVAYGQFVYLQEFFTRAIGFLDMGTSMAFFTKLSARHERKELISFYFLYSAIVLVFIFTFLILVDSLDFVHVLIPDIPVVYIYLGLFFGFFTWLTQVFIKISDAYALTVSVEIIKIAHKGLSLLLLLFFVYQMTFDLELFFYFHYIALVSFLLVVSWLFVEKGIFRNIFNVDFSITSLIKEFMSYCHPLVVMSVVGLLAGLFEIWLLQTTGGNEQTGFYGLAYSLAAMCFLFTGAMTPLITREFSKSYEQKDLESMQKLFSRYIPMLYSIAAYFAVFISFQSENILAIFTDEQFKNAYWVLVVMAFYPIHQTYGQLSGSIFYATGQTKLYRNISLFLAFVGVLLACLFLYFLELGAIGLAWKMVAVQFVGVNIQLYFNAKLLKLDMKKFLWHQIYSVLFFVTMAFISTMLTPSGVPLVEFFISGFIYTVLVIISTYALPQVFATSRDEMRKNLFKARQYVAKK